MAVETGDPAEVILEYDGDYAEIPHSSAIR